MAFFVQRRVQPLHHGLANLWSYSGLEDPTRVSEELMKKENVDKRVRSLTKLTKEQAVADLTAEYFDSVHPLPEVCICVAFCSIVVEYYLHRVALFFAFLNQLACSCTGAPIPYFAPSSSRGRAPSG
jgi:hypothetical protein